MTLFSELRSEFRNCEEYRVSNPSLLGERRKHYLCAVLIIFEFQQALIALPIFTENIGADFAHLVSPAMASAAKSLKILARRILAFLVKNHYLITLATLIRMET